MGAYVVDNLNLRGTYRIRDAKSGLILAEQTNLITSAGKGLVGDMLRNAPTYGTGLTYVALGTGTTAPNLADTVLVTEQTRALMTSKSRLGNTITLSAFFGSSVAGFHIREVGVFGHWTADGTANSGILFSRTLTNYDNSVSLLDLIVDYELQIG